MGGQHSRVSLAPVLLSIGLLASEQKFRGDVSFVPLHSQHALALQVIAFPVLGERELLANRVRPVHSGLAEEACLPPHGSTFQSGQAKVDLFKMVRAIVARDALKINSEE